MKKHIKLSLFIVLGLIIFLSIGIYFLNDNQEIIIKTVAKRDINARSNTSVMLKDGRILITGGDNNSITHNKAVIFDPETNKFIKIPGMTVPRGGHTATLLKDGRVLIVGGDRMINHSKTRYKPIYDNTQTAEIYDPETNKFIKIPDMTEPRYQNEAILLKGGNVLITGGFNPKTDKNLNSAELYDPVKNKFYKTGNMLETRGVPSLTLLKDGRVLFVGGNKSKSTEIYDPNTGKFSYIGESIEPRSVHKSFLLSNGNVLIAGNTYGIKVGENFEIVDKVDSGKYELFDAKTNSFTEYGHMLKNRVRSNSILLNDGRLFVFGGYLEENIVDTKNLHNGEIFNPETKKSKLVKFRWFDWHIEHYKPFLLKNGDVALVGDYDVKIVSFKK